MSSPVGKIVAFLSDYKRQYLRYPVEETPGHGFPVFDSANVLSSYSKFEVVAATISSSYVHIRTVYNNKYWVRSTNDNYWIWAGADEINEDKSSWTCTLFEISNTNEKPNSVRIRHVQLGHYLSLWAASAFYTYGLYAASPDISEDDRDKMIWTDTGSFFVLPKFISFKNSSGAFLGAKTIDDVQHLPFSSKNLEDETVMHESFANGWGGYLIQSSYFGTYWDIFPDGFHSAWITATTTHPELSDDLCRFWVLEAGENNAAVIQTYTDKYYCKEHSSGNKTNCLYGLNTTTFEEAKLQVVETVSGRSINGVEYRQSDARYYDKTKVLLQNSPATNTTAQPIEVSFTVSFSTSTSIIWNSSNSRKVFQKVSLEAELPQILNAKQKNISQEYSWGEAITTTTEYAATLSVPVPSNSTINISVYASITSADIPFIYSQHDTLLNGNKVTTQFEDGLFTVINFVDFNYDIA